MSGCNQLWAHKPLRAVSHVATALWVSLTWTRWFSKWDAVQDCLSSAGPKSWDAWCGVWALHSSGRSSGFCFLPVCGLCCTRSWVCGDLWYRLSSPLWLSFLLIGLMYSHHSDSLWAFIWEGIVPYGAADSVCPWEDGSLGSSKVASWTNPLTTFEIFYCSA